MKVSTYEKLHNLDETMHLHVGYDEHGFDCEGVFFKSLDIGNVQKVCLIKFQVRKEEYSSN